MTSSTHSTSSTRWAPRATVETAPSTGTGTGTGADLRTIESLTEPVTAVLFYETTPTGVPSAQETPEFGTVADLLDATRPTDDDLDRIDPANTAASYARTVSAHCARLAVGTGPALAAFRPPLAVLQTAICDLMADLMHAADLSDMGAEAATERARVHYDAETLGQ